MKKTVTLVEMLFAIILLAVLVLGFYAFNVASTTFFRSSDRKTNVVNELSLIVEHIYKHAIRATGDVVNPGIVVPNVNTAFIRLDLSNNPTPDYDNDNWVRYQYVAANNQLTFSTYPAPGGGSTNTYPPVAVPTTVEILSNRVLRCRFVQPVDGGGAPIRNELAITELATIFDPARAVNGRENPDANMTDLPSGGTSDIVFTSISHSIN